MVEVCSNVQLDGVGRETLCAFQPYRAVLCVIPSV